VVYFDSHSRKMLDEAASAVSINQPCKENQLVFHVRGARAKTFAHSPARVYCRSRSKRLVGLRRSVRRQDPKCLHRRRGASMRDQKNVWRGPRT
jgi:hypothetical protein